MGGRGHHIYISIDSEYNIRNIFTYIPQKVMRSLDVWDPQVGFVSLGKFAPAGAVLLWPHMRFSEANYCRFDIFN